MCILEKRLAEEYSDAISMLKDKVKNKPKAPKYNKSNDRSFQSK